MDFRELKWDSMICWSGVIAVIGRDDDMVGFDMVNWLSSMDFYRQ